MMTITLQVQGMTCGHCKAAVTNALQTLDGVSRVEVHLQEGTVDVDYDETKSKRRKTKRSD
ncbi:Copper chaperone CopZ [Anoxybacillus sp. BCO1]|nr:Copper chaperone CopZ [Anoxybacillus sp. BCO1]